MTEAQKMLAELLASPEPMESHEIRKCMEMLFDDEEKRRQLEQRRLQG